MSFFRVLGLSLLLIASPVWGRGNSKVANFYEAKRLAQLIHKDHPYTLYCNCAYDHKTVNLRSCGYKVRSDPKRAARLEWEHVVPAEAFGQSFAEWREGSSVCQRKNRSFKGRKCAQTNPVFQKMEADLYNLWPEIGELNNLRSNFSMAELSKSEIDFGGCKAKIADRKFEPMPAAKGVVARVYLYMDKEYPGHGIVSEKNRPLFAAWDKTHPPAPWECERAKKIEALQGNINSILADRCSRELASKDVD